MSSSSLYAVELDEECAVNNPLVSNNDVSFNTTSSSNNDKQYTQNNNGPHEHTYKGPLLTAVFIVLAAIHYLTALHAVNALHSNLANITVHILSILVIYSHANCVLRTPGFVQHEWTADPNLNLPFSLPLCKVCNTLKPYRAHHCRQCQRCVLRMDHHCFWVNNCLGYNNYKFFFLMLCYMLLNGFASSVIHVAFFIQTGNGTIPMDILSSFFSTVGTVISLVQIGAGFLFLRMHVWMLCRNLTSVEFTKNSFRWSRMFHFKIDHDYVHAFSRESTFFNIMEAFGPHVLTWPLPTPPFWGNSHPSKLKFAAAYEILPNDDSCEELARLEQQVEDIINNNLREAGLLK